MSLCKTRPLDERAAEQHGGDAALLQDDQVVAFPTETVYGLGGSALSAQAIATIYRVKGRPAHNPLIVHVPDAPSARAPPRSRVIPGGPCCWSRRSW